MLLARRTQAQYRAGTPYSPDRFAAIGQTVTRGHQLFNLRRDPMEVVDLAKQDPKRLESMRSQLDALLKSIQKTAPSWK